MVILMKKVLYFIILCIIYVNPAYARWANFNDAPIKFSRSAKINIDAEGKINKVVEVNATILKEPGRAFAARYIFAYNGDNEKVKILEAKTIYRGKEYKISKKSIEDKPLASASSGLDQHRQILLSFPRSWSETT